MDPINPILDGIFVNQLSVFLIVGALLLLVAELGYRPGLQLHRTQDEPRSKQIEIVQGAVLALLGLLLGFTFAMAAQRFDRRTQLVTEEANAIGTAFLRVSFLPDAERPPVENLFRNYVTVRRERTKAAATPGGLATHEAALAQIQQQLWQQAAKFVRENPGPLSVSYASALNDMFDLDSTRLSATRNHVPGEIWLLLLVISAMGCWFTGYRAGSVGRRSKLALLSLPLLITVVITLVSDLDRPRYGLIGLDERSLRDLQNSMEPAPRNP